MDDALSNFRTDISPWTRPKDWLQSNANHINSVVQGFANFTESSEIEQSNFAGAMIYQHLIVYIFAHLMHCTSDKSILDEFKETLQKWKAWDDITAIENQQLIRDHLISVWQHVLPRPFPSFSTNPDLHPESLLRKLLALDDIRLSTQLALILNDNDRYEQVIDRKGPGAQAILNLLQARLNFPIDATYKLRHVKTLVRLSRSSGLYPECLILNGISIEGDSIASGAFGEVYKGRLGQQTIAVKILKLHSKSDTHTLLKQFASEAAIWGQLSHANVLPFYGVYQLNKDDPRRLCLACSWMENGHLVDFLYSRTPDTDCVPLYLDVAQGLEYLHSENIIHADLKGLNILVSQSHRAYIADFGVTTIMHTTSTAKICKSTNLGPGTPRWQAPELFSDILGEIPSETQPHNTKATDVYGFAMVGYEIFSGDFPFHDVKNEFQAIFAMAKGIRPSRPSHERCRIRGLNDKIWALIENCWAKEPSERPSASQIVERLKALPNRPIDQRPIDDFNILFPFQVLRSQTSYAFSALPDSTVMEASKNRKGLQAPTGLKG